MITDIELLPEATQEAIKRDIENRILPQARNVFEDTPEEFSKYIEDEIKNAVKCKNDMINAAQREGAIIQNISEIYVFNKERIKALKRLKESLKLNQEPKKEDVSLPDEKNTDEAKELPKETPNRGKGRPSKPFSDILVKDKETTKRKLHSLIDGKQDSKAVIYIKAAIQLGMIQKPTHTQFIKEFGSIVSKQIFNKYINGNLYSDDELKGAKQALTNW